MKTTPKRARTLLLTLGLLLSLCACAQKEQTEEAARQHGMSDRPSCGEAMDTQSAQDAFSQEAETSLGWLRDRINFPMTMFGAAYLGYVGGLSEDGFAAGFSGWLWETNEAMLREYPFIAEIDENRPELRADVQEQV